MDKIALVKMLVETMLLAASDENQKRIADGILDIAENKVEKSPNKWDDAIVLPICRRVREAWDIPEFEEEEE